MNDFWRGKRVLVTGHTGFKGSWLSLWLREWGAEVSGLAIEPPSTPSLFEEARIAEVMQSLHGDVRHHDTVVSAMLKLQPEIVFHLAAQSLVRESYVAPVETFETNVLGTVNVLDAVRLTGSVRVAVVITSDKCYENREWPWAYRENDPLGGSDPYSASKGCAEIVTASYRRSFFAPQTHAQHRVAVASARAGNVIGGGDWAADRLVPDVMRAFGAGAKVVIRNPLATRPWQHVLEPLAGYLTLAERLWEAPTAFAEEWNFGPAESDVLQVGDVVTRLSSLWGADAGWVLDEGANPHEAMLLRIDATKARTRLGWKPRLTLDQTLQQIVRWYREYGEGADARELTLREIRAYAAAGESH